MNGPRWLKSYMAFLVNNKSCKLTHAVKTTHCQLCQVTNYLVRAAGLVVSCFSHLVIVRGEGLYRKEAKGFIKPLD